jgi:hypothetical protein
MPKNKEDYSGAKHSNADVTFDYESVMDLSLSQSFIPTNKQGMGDIEASDVTGCNMSGSGNNVFSQHNAVSENHGITGISGTGHTINNYACPPEIVDFIRLLAKKGGIL